MGDTTHPLVSSGTPLDQLLYRSDIEVGARGDIIMFYNKVFISLVKNYALRFTPGDNEVYMYIQYMYMYIHVMYM